MNETLQLPPTSEQLAAAVPTAVFDEVKLTVPDGILAEVVVSETVAVHDEVAPIAMLAGAHDTDVDVLSS